MAANWIKSAVKRPGALKRKAKRAGLSTAAYARKHAHDPGRTGKQARLALTFRKMAHKRKPFWKRKRVGKRTAKRRTRR